VDLIPGYLVTVTAIVNPFDPGDYSQVVRR